MNVAVRRLAAAAALGTILTAGGAIAQQAAPPNVAPRDAPTQSQTGTTAPVPNPSVPGVAPTQQGVRPAQPPATSNTTPGSAPTTGSPAQRDTTQPPSQTTPR